MDGSPRLKTVTPALSRAPVATVAASFALGIWLDFQLALPMGWWFFFVALALAVWLTVIRANRQRAAAWLLVMACLAAGGLRHHCFWSVAANDDIGRYAREAPRPVRLIGRITSQPVIIPKREDDFPSTIPRYDRTFCTVACRALVAGTQEIPVSGTVKLEVTGHLLHIDAGDEIDVVGSFSRPSGPRNPGGFDYDRYLRRQGMRVIVRTQFPDAVRKIRPGSGRWNLFRVMAGLRLECEQILRANLSSRNAPVGIALLLGNRTAITDETRTAFAESGTMHFLALSGLHVGILASLLWGICRLLRVSNLVTSCLLLACLIGYSFLNDARPSVIRATVMAGVMLAGRPWNRRASLVNSLAVAAILLLLWNPAQLFQVGPQLSFLAVLAIAAAASFLWNSHEENEEPDADPADLPSERAAAIRRIVDRPLKWLGEGYVITAAIWVFTLPLVSARFHLASPVGFLINVLLMPIVVVVLWSGYCLLFCGLLLPPLVPVFATVFDTGLWAFLGLVNIAGEFRFGHWYVPGPENWWLTGFYALLFAAALGQRLPQVSKWRAPLMLGWMCLGLAVAIWQPWGERLRCTFLSVGHGCAIVVETPDGRTFLYDAGQLHDSRRTERIVENALWDMGISRLDGVIISHADVDHFNAIPGILEKIPIDRVFVSPTFLKFQQPAVAAVCEELAASGVPIQLVGADDQFLLAKQLRMRVLQPAADSQHENDNANSVVVAIDYGGRRILLTGDLEEAGLETLLARERLKADVILSPHHGSPRANTPELAAWCRPDWVIVSGGRARGNSLQKLRDVYGPTARVLSTWESGAVSVTIDAAGDLDVKTFAENSTMTRKRP